jgi:hypothetical protein
MRYVFLPLKVNKWYTYKRGQAGFVKDTKAKLQYSTSYFTLTRTPNLIATAVIYVKSRLEQRFGHIHY